MRRRIFLHRGLAAGGLLAATTLPLHRALAADAPTGNRRKFIFVVNYGGWDPTRVFAAEFDNLSVDMERAAQSATVGDLTYVDHAQRPAVRAFMDKHYAQTLIVKGILVPSVAHENCLRLAMTGSTRQDASDWPAIMAGTQGGQFALPHVVAAGPSFPGEFGAFVTRTGTSGQLPALLDGSIIGWSDSPTVAPPEAAEAIMDEYLSQRLAATVGIAAPGREATLAAAYATSLERSRSLKGLKDIVDWSQGSTFTEQAKFGVDVLALGVSRCVTLSFSYNSWDTHVSNDIYQSQNFQMLFTGLGELMDLLASVPGETASTLAEETVVIVLSEMGRTPQLNAGQGKDHWPYTSAMLVGPGITGNRVVGAYDALYYGKKLDLASGEVDDDGGQSLSSDVLGATMLSLADVDSGDYLPGVARADGLVA